LKFKWPEESQNRVVKIANLIKKGFARWEKLPKIKRNIAIGVSFAISSIILPKLLLTLIISSVCAGRHLYLTGEVEEAAKLIFTDKDDVFHP
jgi:ribose/xylose/arabinose/galactoside ABC-type transport system permease subunit